MTRTPMSRSVRAWRSAYDRTCKSQMSDRTSKKPLHLDGGFSVVEFHEYILSSKCEPKKWGLLRHTRIIVNLDPSDKLRPLAPHQKYVQTPPSIREEDSVTLVCPRGRSATSRRVYCRDGRLFQRIYQIKTRRRARTLRERHTTHASHSTRLDP
jgi:hypothetical protein